MAETASKLELATLEDEFKVHERFCKVLLDAYAIVAPHGRVVRCNPLFSQVVGLNTRQVLKAESFDELLALSLDKEPYPIKKILELTNPTRLDEMRATNTEGKELNLIIGVYPFVHEDDHLGSFILIRDVTAEANLQDKYKDKATQSITDPLTGLFNRHYFESYLHSQVKAIRAQPNDSEQTNMALIMLDIDHFKRINDEKGHQAGDHVLKEISALMKKLCRKTDIICRYGGEEFLAILPATNLNGAKLVAEKIRKAIETKQLAFNQQAIPVTISSGVAQFMIHSEEIESTIARADEALYQAKANGRNRVYFHDGDQTSS